MFSFNNKLDPNLKEAINDNLHKNYRVIVRCSTLLEKIEKKIFSMRCEVIHSVSTLNCICAILSTSAIVRLIEYPQVKYISMDRYAFICGNSVQSSNKLKSYKNIKFTGKNIGIGLIDTGVYPHADLIQPNTRIKKFVDLINQYNYPYDDNGHGTFMAGLICGSGFSSKGRYKGIAINSHIYSIKAFNKLGRAYISDTLLAIQTLIDESDKYNIKIICLPFETLYYNKFILSLFQNIFDKAVEKEIVVIVPSGNIGGDTDSITGIATLPNCLTIGGIDTMKGLNHYEYSSSGPCCKLEKPNFVAACAELTSLNSNVKYVSERNSIKLYPTRLEQPYTNYTGTSCAAAFISGVCALLFEKNPDLTFKDISSLLKYSCEFINIPKNQQGAGMININSLFE